LNNFYRKFVLGDVGVEVLGEEVMEGVRGLNGANGEKKTITAKNKLNILGIEHSIMSNELFTCRNSRGVLFVSRMVLLRLRLQVLRTV